MIKLTMVRPHAQYLLCAVIQEFEFFSTMGQPHNQGSRGNGSVQLIAAFKDPNKREAAQQKKMQLTVDARYLPSSRFFG